LTETEANARRVIPGKFWQMYFMPMSYKDRIFQTRMTPTLLALSRADEMGKENIADKPQD